jgi:hypothetical protein
MLRSLTLIGNMAAIVQNVLMIVDVNLRGAVREI